MLRVRYQYQTGATLGYSIERLSDGTFWDFAVSGATANTFTASPATQVESLPEDSGNFQGRYFADLVTPGAQFTNGAYCVTVHDMNNGNRVVGELGSVMYDGDDAPVFPSPGGIDPWSVNLPGSYGPGTAGGLVGSLSFTGNNVNAVLASAGMDGVTIESGVNARQALSVILAASAGVLSGAGTGTIIIKGGNVNTTRIVASTDAFGNRTSVTLTLPT